ncbi:MAG: M4 family metallopeptidase, partial [Vicinamibacterales bacterium]
MNLRPLLSRAVSLRRHSGAATVQPNPATRARLVRGFLSAAVAALTALSLASQTPALKAGQGDPTVPEDLRSTVLQDSECLEAGRARVGRHRRTRAMRFVGSRAGRPLRRPFGDAQAVSPEEVARRYFDTCGSLFGATNPRTNLAQLEATTDVDGRSVVRLQQLHRGVPVIGGEIVVNLAADKSILSVTGKLLPRVRLSTRATVLTTDAAAMAVRVTAIEHRVPDDELVAAPPQLWVYSPMLIGEEGDNPRLVWRHEVTHTSALNIRQMVLTDARTGEVALSFNQVEEARNRLTYTASNGYTLPGTLQCAEATSACGGDVDAQLAHQYAADTYDFYLSQHGRDSWNGIGGSVVSTVHYGSGYLNAFWSGSQMVYGDAAGFARADDVVGHEITHGVTQATSNLLYRNQSGAINESFSDIWGEFIDQTNGRGNDRQIDRWYLGEDITGYGAIRHMEVPSLYGHPDRMTSNLYVYGSYDNGGVHINSGIGNKAAQLMVDGGTFNGQTVIGLGIPKTAKIYYEAQTRLLTSGSDYADLHEALYQACNNLVGSSGIVANDCAQVRKATLAVEMDREPTAGTAAHRTDMPACDAGKSPVNVFSDDFEAGIGQWSTTAGTGSNRWSFRGPYSRNAHSGTGYLFADDYPAATADSTAAMVTAVTLPSGAFLHFSHEYLTAGGSGGVVEYTADGGATWTDAGSLFDGGGYNVASLAGTPMGTRAVFSGSSGGYFSSRMNLASLAGQSVRFRWRFSRGSSFYSSGWWVDDVRIYTCANTGPVPGDLSSPGPADAATGVSIVAPLSWVATNATSYDIAFGTTNPPPAVATAITDSSYRAPLTYGTTYYWRVTARNANGITQGPVWSFTTDSASDWLLLDDTFVDVDKNLSSHTPTFNRADARWVSQSGVIRSNTLVSGIPGLDRTAFVNTGVAEQGSVSASIRIAANGTSRAGVLVRYKDDQNFLLVRPVGNLLTLVQREGGADRVLWDWPIPSPAAGSVHTLTASFDGPAITARWDTVQMMFSTPYLQGSSKSGLYWPLSLAGVDAIERFRVFGNCCAIPAPAVASAPTPADGAVSVPLSTSMSWTAQRSVSYDIAFGTTSPPPVRITGLRLFTVDSIQASLYLGALAERTKYYWQVIARGPGGTTQGPIWSFTTTGLPSASIVSPSDGATALSPSTALRWSGSEVTSYDLYLGTASPPPLAAAGLSSDSYLPVLEPGRTYFWRLDYRGPGGFGSTVTRSFTTRVAPPPPSGLTPCATTGIATDVSLKWSSEAGLFHDVWIGTGVLVPSTFLPSLDYGTTYRWNVSARDSVAGQASISAECQFTTAPRPSDLILEDRFRGPGGLVPLEQHPIPVNPRGMSWSAEPAGNPPVRGVGYAVSVQPYSNDKFATVAGVAGAHTVTANLWTGSGAVRSGVVVRYKDPDNYWLVRSDGNLLQIVRRLNGVSTVVWDWPIPSAKQFDHRLLTVRVDGNTITATIGGVTTQYASADLSGESRVGLFWPAGGPGDFVTLFQLRADPPSAPSAPSPVDGQATDAGPTTLSWSSGSNATSYDVAFGSSGLPPAQSSGIALTAIATGLTTPSLVAPLGGAYNYWQVTAHGPGGSVVGPRWHFNRLKPSAPTNTGPASGSSDVPLSALLTFSCVPG